jgi:hypothetical protein
MLQPGTISSEHTKNQCLRENSEFGFRNTAFEETEAATRSRSPNPNSEFPNPNSPEL